MAELGWDNPFPFELGGGRTAVRRHYDAIRAAVGTGGASEDDESIDAMWRQQRATALAALAAFAERAALQAFPDHAIDGLGSFESILGIVPTAGESEQDRRVAVARGWTDELSAVTEPLVAALQALNPSITILTPTDDSASGRTQHGRPFEPFDPGPYQFDPFGPRLSTVWPNFSDDFIVIVVVPPLGTTQTDADRAFLARVRALVDQALPAWVTYRLIASVGFLLDTPAQLDAVGFGS